MKCDADIRKDLYGNIVLAGGSSMFNGLSERLNKEVVSNSKYYFTFYLPIVH